MAVIELYVSTEVSSTTMECDTYVPASGKKFKVLDFYGVAPPDVNCSVDLIWILDHSTESEDLIWNIENTGSIPAVAKAKTLKTDADGIRKLGLCLNNGLTGSVYMSGYAKIWIQD